jgi:hypothetical protein
MSHCYTEEDNLANVSSYMSFMNYEICEEPRLDNMKFMLCVWASIVYGLGLIMYWGKQRFTSYIHRIIREQQEVNQKQIDEINVSLSKRKQHSKETHIRLNNHISLLELKIEELQNMLEMSETEVSNLRGEVSTNHETYKKYINQNNLDINSIYNDIYSIKNLNHRVIDLEYKCSLHDKYNISLDDDYKQAWIEHLLDNARNKSYVDSNTTELDKYIGNSRMHTIISRLTQVSSPRYSSFGNPTKREDEPRPGSVFIDYHMNVVANAIEWGCAHDIRQHNQDTYYKSVLEKVKDYCQTLGMKSVA